MSTKSAVPVWRRALILIAMGAGGAVVGAALVRGVVHLDGLRSSVELRSRLAPDAAAGLP